MPEPVTITLCGDGGCGKSAITLRLVRSQWLHEYDPTIEDSYSLTRFINGRPYQLSIIDTAGQKEYRDLWVSSDFRSDAFLFVYDVTNPPSLYALEYFHNMVAIASEHRQELAMEQLAQSRRRNERGAYEIPNDLIPPICFVVGNKCDLKYDREISSRQGLDWARQNGCCFMETSARENVGIEKTFELTVQRVVEAREKYQQAFNRPSLQSLYQVPAAARSVTSWRPQTSPVDGQFTGEHIFEDIENSTVSYLPTPPLDPSEGMPPSPRHSRSGSSTSSRKSRWSFTRALPRKAAKRRSTLRNSAHIDDADAPRPATQGHPYMGVAAMASGAAASTSRLGLGHRYVGSSDARMENYNMQRNVDAERAAVFGGRRGTVSSGADEARLYVGSRSAEKKRLSGWRAMLHCLKVG